MLAKRRRNNFWALFLTILQFFKSHDSDGLRYSAIDLADPFCGFGNEFDHEAEILGDQMKNRRLRFALWYYSGHSERSFLIEMSQNRSLKSPINSHSDAAGQSKSSVSL